MSSYEHFTEMITQDQHDYLVSEINKLEWSKELTRDVQHFGWKYDYKTRRVTRLDKPIPAFLRDLVGRFYPTADQIIINRYFPGQGIASHCDADVFDDLVLTLSLCAGIEFNIDGGSIYLKPRDMVVMKRPVWHSIDRRTTDVVDGVEIPRQTRISVTFRRVRV